MAVSCGICDLNFAEPDEGPEEACTCWKLRVAGEIIPLREYEWSASLTGDWQDGLMVELSPKEIYGLFR